MRRLDSVIVSAMLGCGLALTGCGESDPSDPATVYGPASQAPPGPVGPFDMGVPNDVGPTNNMQPVAQAPQLPCDVADLLSTYCASCHGTALRGGAPLSLMTSADFMALRDDGVSVGERVIARIGDDTRPMPPPPAARLGADEIAVLKGFVDGGSQSVQGGCAVQEPAAPTTMMPSTTPMQDPTGGKPTTDPSQLGSGANWSMFGHDLANTRANEAETALSPETVASLKRHWDLSGAATTSTPAVVDGVVYLPTWDGKVSALNLSDGSEVWTAQLPNLIDSSAAVSDTQVFVGDNTGLVHALDRETGEVQWSQTADNHSYAHLWSSPVYIADAGLVVVGVASGEEELMPPYSFRGSVVAFDADSGAMAWQFYTTDNDGASGAGVAVWSTAAVDTGRQLLYIGTGNTYGGTAGPLTDSMLALDYTSGELKWSHQFTANDVFTVTVRSGGGPDYDLGSTANLFSLEGKDYVGIGVKNGIYYALDRDTGDVEWMTEVTAGSVLGGVISASAYSDGFVYVASNRFFQGGSDVVAIDAMQGRELWRVSIDKVTYGGVAFANGVVYVANDSATVFAFDAADGTELWRDTLPNATAGSPAVADGRLLVPWGYQWTLGRGMAGTGGMIVYGQ